jgi:hypothetical protein
VGLQRHYSSRTFIIQAIQDEQVVKLLDALPVNELPDVFRNWIERFESVIQTI